ncbi:hypothetical protein SDC9_193380 [bioreactor metagenome]|uniref:Uncharacterized protein n=1 Tax=bioreactor metagenome TaxID=1076179 RepID=A0A645I3I0_9ZZZZ
MRCVGAASQIIKGYLVGGDHTGTSAGFDGHIADGHASFHIQGADGGASVFQHITNTATDANFGDKRQNDIFGGHPKR